MNALTMQVAGSHYKSRGVQPVQFIYANQWDFFLGSALKYVTRWRDKAGVVDLQKAKHFLQLREELLSTGPMIHPIMVITMDNYITANAIPEGHDGAALLALESYALHPIPSNRDVFFSLVDRLIALDGM